MDNYANSRADFTAQGSHTPDALIAGDFPLQTRKVTVITGQNLARGAVLGIITASGKVNLSLSAAADGSQTPALILAEPVDATAADKEAVAYISGEFNEDQLILGTAHTVASIKEGLRGKSIFLKTPVSI